MDNSWVESRFTSLSCDGNYPHRKYNAIDCNINNRKCINCIGSDTYKHIKTNKIIWDNLIKLYVD